MITYEYRQGKFPHVLKITYQISQNDDRISTTIDSNEYYCGRVVLINDINDWLDETVGCKLLHYHMITGSEYYELRFLEKDKALQFKLMWCN
jgi:hypothetical protein